MEQLNDYTAKRFWDDLEIKSAPEDQYDLVTISGKSHDIKVAQLNEVEIKECISGLTSDHLQLVHLKHPNQEDEDEWFHISEDLLKFVVKTFNIDPYLLPRWWHCSDGFMHTQNEDSDVHTFFFGGNYVNIVWSFESKKSRTRAIALSRYPDIKSFGEAFELNTIFKSLVKSVYYAPVVFSLWELEGWEDFIQETIDEYREIEKQSGYGPMGNERDSNDEFSIEEITKLSQDLSSATVGIANCRQGLSIIEDMIDCLLDIYEPDDLNEQGHKLNVVTHALKSRIRCVRADMGFLVENGKCLSKALYNLLTHEDALTNLKLASTTLQLSETSIELAHAAKRDSSSMKAVAILTMAFLPATFLASFWQALLRFDSPPVIRRDFWIYWAVSVPSTAACFIIWFVATHQTWIRTFITEQFFNLARMKPVDEEKAASISTSTKDNKSITSKSSRRKGS